MAQARSKRRDPRRFLQRTRAKGSTGHAFFSRPKPPPTNCHLALGRLTVLDMPLNRGVVLLPVQHVMRELIQHA
jgi:hypothetical protein